MKALFLIFFLLLSFIDADFASSSLIEKVEKKYDRFAKNRFVALNDLLEKSKNEPTSKKLEKVNDFFNKVRYGSDKEVFGSSDYWANPFEFLAKDRGDCEDYVIAKFLALEYLGIPASKMFLSYVRLKGSKDAHMVLSYYESPNSEPLILDNFRKIVLGASKRDDLTFVFNFNPNIKSSGSNSANSKWNTMISQFKGQKI
ncbi:transglutaminase-like cysteine peptidase [Arcobacter vandammei]|uniref:transglutaminase-like cysteine peptidase n=1 Tax=Arcobacter vandammei TaxID=2782243 RepID=UPI0018DF5AFF|nr:transglutaminase-like cysteine peptidase [Arcobacter vandammei]